MAPKPRPIRKTSISKATIGINPTGQDASKSDKEKAATAAMPPPPPPQPRGILEPEVAALSECLRNATVKTGQLMGFYADVKQLGLAGQIPNPPRPLVAALGREVERYDQLCDMIETHLQHAIAVLERDLVAEEERVKANEAAMASKTRSKTPSSSPTLTRATVSSISTGSSSAGGLTLAASPTSMDTTMLSGDQGSPTAPPDSAISNRRPSVISLSSLHRPFPHKLDLSAPALRLGGDEFAQGLSSPVTLAPRTARPSAVGDLPPELLAMVADAAAQPLPPPPPQSQLPPPPPPVQNQNNTVIDLTLPDPPIPDMSLGSSADKPIELDLDMDMGDIFGETKPDIHQTAGPSQNDPLQGLNAPQVDSTDIFATLGSSVGAGVQEPSISNQAATMPAGAPSPGSLLASLSAVSSSGGVSNESAPEFDMTNLEVLSNMPPFGSDFFGEPAETFGGTDADISMEDLMKIGTETANTGQT